jgi:3-oxoacyl-[acyl-carrier protein] reductase
MKKMQKYINRVNGHALVLGGSGGIGREIVLALVANGASAISFTYGRNKAAAEKLAKQLKAMGVKNVHYVQADVPKTDAAVITFRRLLEDIVRTAGKEITVAVNAVGISPNQPFEKQKIGGPNGWLDVFETNVFGSVFSTREIAMRMRRKGIRGSIVLITSTNGINSQAEFSSHYDHSKAAQGSFRSFAEKYARQTGIRINAIAPGWVDTPMNDSVPPKELARERARIWLGRLAEPSEIAAVVAFVAGTGGSFIVGQEIIVDGGYR